MIESLYGKVLKICKDYIVLDVLGIGIKVYCSNPLFYNTEEKYFIECYALLKENEIDVYGFIDKDQKLLFLQLIKVSGVGPKTAFNMLKSSSIEQIVNSINYNDVDYLKGIGGIGIKTAKQLILELNGKIKINTLNENKAIYDTRIALKSLGFKNSEIDACFLKLKKNYDTSDECLKDCLREIEDDRRQG